MLKRRKLFVFILLIVATVCGCATVKDNESDVSFGVSKSENIQYNDSYFEDLASFGLGLDSATMAGVVDRLRNSEKELENTTVVNTEEYAIKGMMLVSPNPTSSSVTITFFNNFPNRTRLLPHDFTVDLYYLKQKIHTFNFPQSSGVETTPSVFGLLKRNGKVYTQVVKNCSVSELIPIIEELASKKVLFLVMVLRVMMG